MRSMLFSSDAMLVANEARKCPGAPKPEPGTTATPASLMSISAKALSSLHAERHHRGAAIGPGVERAGRRQRDDAGQAVQRADEPVVALLELDVHGFDAASGRR